MLYTSSVLDEHRKKMIRYWTINHTIPFNWYRGSTLYTCVECEELFIFNEEKVAFIRTQKHSFYVTVDRPNTEERKKGF